jgi:hypothetical protein
MDLTLILEPSVPDFGWVLCFGDAGVRPATTWYSKSQGQLVISQVDMARLSREHIRLIEKFEQRMIDHICECESLRHLRQLVCTQPVS